MNKKKKEIIAQKEAVLKREGGPFNPGILLVDSELFLVNTLAGDEKVMTSTWRQSGRQNNTSSFSLLRQFASVIWRHSLQYL